MNNEITITPLSLDEAKKLGIESWSEWGCGISSFDWSYTSTETAYVFEGEVTVTANGVDYHINPNDLVVFPKGLECSWNVLKPIRKVYKFED